MEKINEDGLNFELTANRKVPIICFFYQKGCQASLDMAVKAEAMSRNTDIGAVFFSVEASDTNFVNSAEIKSFPAFAIYKNGKLQERRYGNIKQKFIEDWIAEYA